jgi:cytochrome c5
VKISIIRCILIVAIAIAAGCGTSSGSRGDKKSSSTIPLSGPFATAESVEAGRSVYVQKCARCHRFYDPAAYPDEEWQSWMKKMTRKARLTSEQASLINQYLNSFRSSQ